MSFWLELLDLSARKFFNSKWKKSFVSYRSCYSHSARYLRMKQGFVLHPAILSGSRALILQDWSSLPATRARVFLNVVVLFLNINHALLPLQGNLLLTGDKDQLVMLLDQINSTFVRSNLSVLQGLLRIIPYLSFGEIEKMQILVDRFKPYCNFDKYVVIFQLKACEISCTDKFIPFLFFSLMLTSV